MIRWAGVGADNRKRIGLGITRENVKRMQAGQPIRVSGEQFGILGVDIVIHYGHTEAAIVAEMRKLGVDAPLERKDVEGDHNGE